MTTTELETLNLTQPMDDMKREMYIRARARIVSGECYFICWALLAELGDTCNVVDMESSRESETTLGEFFPEFFDLYDKYYWPNYSVKELESIERCVALFKDKPHDVWFNHLDKPRRLRLLDFLITHR